MPGEEKPQGLAAGEVAVCGLRASGGEHTRLENWERHGGAWAGSTTGSRRDSLPHWAPDEAERHQKASNGGRAN